MLKSEQPFQTFFSSLIRITPVKSNLKLLFRRAFELGIKKILYFTITSTQPSGRKSEILRTHCFGMTSESSK